MKPFLLLPLLAVVLQAAEPVPVLFDTDIGTDIDDAYALAQIVRSPELKLLGVTTVSGDAVARARLAAKLLAVAERKDVPVYAGTSTATQYMSQVEWAKGFTSSALHESGGVQFMRDQIKAHPGEIAVIAVGELTNVAALLESEPGIGKKIKAIALMGGSIRRGYAPGSKPEPEWNIKSAAKAAQVVFASGVPLLVAPLDSTADLKLTPEGRVTLFSRGVPLNDALAALNSIWRHTNTWKGENPTLFDNLAVALVATPGVAPLTPMHLVVDDNGLTREITGAPANAQVALTCDPHRFLEYITDRLSR
ncbi:MAG TPA: nucleoside hydrolase [Lacunisphaera sp.]|nr:nucleoside hydrolase [Lacunisphaera sp.]